MAAGQTAHGDDRLRDLRLRLETRGRTEFSVTVGDTAIAQSVRKIAPGPAHSRAGLTVSLDGLTSLYAQAGSADSDLMLVENFQ